jgi:hypothetical protein
MKLSKKVLGLIKTTVLAYLMAIVLLILIALIWLGYIKSVGVLVAIAIFTVAGTVTIIAVIFKQLVKFIEDIKEL